MKTKHLLFTTALGMAGILNAQSPFPVVDEDFYNPSDYPADLTEVMIPASPLKYDVLFVGGVDSVKNKNGISGLAKEWQDFTGYVPINGRSDSGYVVVNHERVEADPINGDGGGMTVFTVYYNQSTESWEVKDDPKGKFRNVDFSNVGGTGANCGGIQTSWGKVFTAEEWGSSFSSNAVIYNGGAGITDTSDYTVETFNGTSVSTPIKKHMNFQYMVEVDVANAMAVRKNYNMGRYDHEGGWIASDKKTVYLSDDYSSGAVLFKFVANTAEDFSQGTLYCYQQSDDGLTGTWLPLTMDLNTMMDARNAAYALGATIFMRLEWVEGINDNTVFITETGRGKTQSVKNALLAGATLANHLVQLDVADGKKDSSFTDMWGRVLRLNTATGTVESAVEGGGTINRSYNPTKNHLSSPDGLTSTVIDGKTFLAINEDMNPGGNPGSPKHFATKLNEIYMLDVTNDAPGKEYKITDLQRFLVGPSGCETTGGRFTPDGSTYFVNIQHPSASNTYPFNHSVTLAVTGFKEIMAGGAGSGGPSTKVADVSGRKAEGMQIHPNPATREIYLNEAMDIAIYDVAGKRVMVQRNTDRVDISGLTPGTYVVKNAVGEAVKIIIQ